MNALVTGATGFIGQYLVQRLLAEGVTVRALVLPNEPLPSNWDEVAVVRGDITHAADVSSAVAGVDVVFHLAAVVQDWGSQAWHAAVTVTGTRHVFDAAVKTNAHVILISSVTVYGHHIAERECDERRAHGDPQGPYSRSKQAQEHLATAMIHSDALRCTIVRPGNVYGVGSKLWVNEVINELRRGTPSLIGKAAKNAGLCHVKNLVEVLWLAATTPAAVGQTYNAADGIDVTWEQYFTDLATVANTAPPKHIPHGIVRAIAPLLEAIWRPPLFKTRPPLTREALNLVGSDNRFPIDNAVNELGYQPVISYAEAMAELKEHLTAH